MSHKRDWEQLARRHGYHRLKMRTEFESLSEKMLFDLNVVQKCSLRKIEKMIQIPETSVCEQIRHYPWHAGVEMLHSTKAITEMAMARGVSVQVIAKEQNGVKICNRCHKKYNGPNKRTCPTCVKKRSEIYDCGMI